MVADPSGVPVPDRIRDLLGVRRGEIVTFKDIPGENGSWLVRTMAGERVVLRRYHAGATAADLAYEHAVLDHLERAGNVHYEHGRLAGVIDFGLTHLDSRPYELAIARTYRSPQVIDAYRAELAASGWPLSDLEESAIVPVYQAFRVDMAAWSMETGRVSGSYNLAMIERQLARSGTPVP